MLDFRSSGGSPYLLLPFVPLLSCCRDCVEDFIVLGRPRSPRRKYTSVNIKILSRRREHPKMYTFKQKKRKCGLAFYCSYKHITYLLKSVSGKVFYDFWYSGK